MDNVFESPLVVEISTEVCSRCTLSVLMTICLLGVGAGHAKGHGKFMIETHCLASSFTHMDDMDTHELM